MPKHNAIDYPVDQIRQWIESGQTQQQIADELAKTLDPRITAKSIYKVCKKHGIACQRTGPRAGEGHPEWSGGRTVGKHGYIRVWCPDHPTCRRINARRSATANGGYFRKQKYVWEHRLVMEQHLGRYLRPEEVVHHLNGVKDDNRLDNLKLYASNAEHLADDLAGKCPRWSPAGKARILAAVHRRSATARQRRELCDRPLLQTTPRLTATPETLAAVLS